MPNRRTHEVRGFTLIEILMVVVIISLLATIAVPKFIDTKGKAFVAAMKSDLKNMAGAAEAWYFENRSYVGYVAPQGSTGITLTVNTTTTGWSGHAVHASTTITCDIQVGSSLVAPNGEGNPFCQ